MSSEMNTSGNDHSQAVGKLLALRSQGKHCPAEAIAKAEEEEIAAWEKYAEALRMWLSQEAKQLVDNIEANNLILKHIKERKRAHKQPVTN